MAAARKTLEVAGREVTITNPDKVYFPEIGLTKLGLVRYYLAVADGALRGVAGRPMALKRYVNGVTGEAFYQKRAPRRRPDWIETVELRYPSGGVAHEIVLRDPAQLAWVVNLGCVDLHPHPVRAQDLLHPDELRVDLDPVPGVAWSDVLRVALVVRQVLVDFGLVGWPKTSGSRGFHVYCRIRPEWTFTEVRRAGYALAREVAKRAPDLATAQWWKENRRGVFVDYNQNAKDHTTASQYSVRPTPDGRVSMPLHWDEVARCDPAAFTVETAPARFAGSGDAAAGIDEAVGSLTALLEYAAKERLRVPAAGGTTAARGTMPLIEIARARLVDEAMAGLERWKARHPEATAYLRPPDVLVDSMRGRSSTWTRIRVNLQHVPPGLRPEQEPLEVDYDPWRGAAPPEG